MPIIRNIIHFAAIFLSVVILTSLSGCADREPVYRIGVSQCSSDDWREKMNGEINREAMFHHDIEVEIRSAEDSSEKQIADLRYFAENDFDIIIAAPNEADALTPVIEEIYNSGTPVLLFDRNIHGNSFTAFQGADNVAIGRSAAMEALNLIDGNIKVLEIKGLSGSTPADERERGFAEIVAGEPRLSVIGSAHGNWNAVDATRVADSLIKAFPDVNLIYAHNDRMAIAAAETARSLGVDNIKVIGIDAAPNIGIRAVADGKIDATFLYPTDGYRLIRTALSILNGEPYDTVAALGRAGLVDISNAELLLRQDEELEDETSKLINLQSEMTEFVDRHDAQTTILYMSIGLAIALCLLLFALLKAYWIRRHNQEKLAAQNSQLEEQRDQVIELNRRLSEATQSKLMFFTNVSHDLRTPLTLISGSVDSLDSSSNLTDEQTSMVKLAKKNIKVLMRLINQILDFRKYENGALEVNLSEVDLGAMLHEWCESFKIISRTRDIRFEEDFPHGDELVSAVDVEKIERVMFNLISNAFKYTGPHGVIKVSARKDADNIVISVTDTGRGISAEDLSHIFERFFQVDKVHPNGSGIGLALAKAFIELHGGTLTAESEPGKGSIFTITLPVKHIDGEVITSGSCITTDDVKLELGEISTSLSTENPDKTTVLVIDDNHDIRTLVSSILTSDYDVITAADGSEGLKMAAKYIPDLIICDVMMPGMDGLECCRRLKSEQSTSHIPVLMLTACSMDEQRVQGYECGADGYMSKPFNRDVLLARCRSLIANRRLIKELWSSPLSTKIDAKPDARMPRQTDGIGPVDSEFYARFCEIVEKNMSDADLSVDTIAGMLGLGRTQFYRKIKALTNYSPVELLRNMRLAKARTLLLSTDKSVSEIAYEVGFSAPAYFGKCYKDRYGETPTEIRESMNQ